MAFRATDWDNIPGFDPVNQEFVRLDPNRWLKDHGIIDEARKQGEQNLPAVDEQRSDGIPARIFAWINRRGLICRQNVSRHLSDLERNLADMENPEELLVLEQEVGELLGNAEIAVEGKLNHGRNRLHNPERELREENVDFEEFRRENSLRRQPDYSSRRSALRYVYTFFAIELVLNATMLMEVNAFGLLGSVVQMGLIGLVNVGIFAWCMGGVIRQMADVRVARKRLFTALAVVIVLGVIAFNLVVGHFRDSMQAVLGDATADIFSVGSDTFDRFASGMFALDSFQSALLALLGFLFFCVASWKWLDRDDHYPDYGRRHRRLQEKRQAYVKKFNSAQQELKSTFDDFQSQLADIRQRLVMKQSRWREHCIQGERIVKEFPTNLGQYQHDLNQLLGAYYTANRSTRTGPAPTWFSEQMEVDSTILLAPTFTPPEQNSLTSVANKVDEAIGTLQSTFKSAMRQFRTLDSVLADSSGVTESTQ